MPRYHFHVIDGEDFIDRKGTELAGPGEAKTHALQYAGALIGEAGSEIWSSDWCLRVTNGDNLTLYSLMLVAQEASAMGSRRTLGKPG